MNDAKQKGNIKLFACGGAGINLGKTFEHMRGQDAPMFALVDICYLDTSKANLQDNALPLEAIYRVPGADGSGQVRREHAEAIFAHAPAMLEKHRPGKANIVLHSLSGGSGSVIGPALVSEMLARGESVIVICIGETDTIKHIDNTHMALLSYVGIVNATEKPVVAAYFQNSNLTPEAEVNKAIGQLITALCVLYSGENISMDTQDLYNWLNFDKVTDFAPQLALLSLFEGSQIDDNSIGNVITVATLATEDGPSGLDQVVEYQKVGRLPKPVVGEPSMVHMQAPIHFVTSDGVYSDLIEKLETQLADHRRKASARVPKPQQDLLKKVAGSAAKNGVVV